MAGPAVSVRVDADTSAFATKLNGMRQSVQRMADGFQKWAGPFGSMATAAGIVAAAGSTASNAWRDFWDRLARANKDAKELRDAAQALAFGVGRPGAGGTFERDIDFASRQGVATTDQLTQGVGALTSRNTSAPQAVVRAALNAAADVSTASGGDQKTLDLFMSIVGIFTEQGVDVNTAINLAIPLSQGVGDMGNEIVNALPLLMAGGFSPEEAAQIALGLKTMGRQRSGKTLSTIGTFLASGAQGGMAGLTRALQRTDPQALDAINAQNVGRDNLESLRFDISGNRDLLFSRSLGVARNEAASIRRDALASRDEEMIDALVDRDTADIRSDPIGAGRLVAQAQRRGFGAGDLMSINPIVGPIRMLASFFPGGND